MIALIDADIFAYEFGNVKDDSGQPLGWPLVASRVDSRIHGILERVGASSRRLFLTSDDRSNFRYRVATIKPYKGHRPEEKPYWYERIREWLVKYRGAEVVYGMEADDRCSIEQMKGLNEGYETVICSRDKDLKMVPGRHYTWPAGKQREEFLEVDDTGGSRRFFSQCLTGDPVDNILGLYGVGPKSASVLRLGSLTSVLDMYELVREEYLKRFGNYWEDFLQENAVLLWMLREEPDDSYSTGKYEILYRLIGLEEEYQNKISTGRADGLIPIEEEEEVPV